MKIKGKCPLELIMVIVDRRLTDKVVEFLNNKKSNKGMVFMGKGTADSEIADMFSFGIKDRDVIVNLITSGSSQKLMLEIDEIFNFQEKNNGLALSIPIANLSSNLIDIVK